MAANTVEDIRDIYAPYSISSPLSFMLIALIVCAVIGIIGYFFYKIRKKKTVTTPFPYEIALKELETLKDLIPFQDKAKEFAQQASRVVREYIEAQYSIFVQSKTTQEFLYYVLDMSNVGIEKYRDLLKDFLLYCDLAKFAKWELEASQKQNMLDSAIRFVKESSETSLEVK